MTIASIAGLWEGLASGGGDNLDISQQMKYEIRTSCRIGKPCVVSLDDPTQEETPFSPKESSGNTFCFSDTYNLYCFTLQSDGTAAFKGGGPMWAATGILTKRGATAVGATPAPYSGDVSSIELVGKMDVGGAIKIDFVDNLAFTGAPSGKLQIYDVSNPASPVAVQIRNSPSSWDFGVAGKYVYVIDDSSLEGVEIDALDTSNLQGSLKSIPYGSAVHGRKLRTAGDRIYFLDDNNKIHILDFSPTSRFRELGTFTIPRDANNLVSDFAIAGDFAYVVVSGDGLHIVDVSDPKSAHEVGFFDIPGTTYQLAVAGQFAYIAALDDGLHIIDVSNPEKPVETGPYGAKTKYIETVTVAGKYAYLYVDTDHIEVVDIANPLAPVLVGSTDLHGVSSINVNGNYMYVAGGQEGISIYLLKN